jgi:hypothetical protein
LTIRELAGQVGAPKHDASAHINIYESAPSGV